MDKYVVFLRGINVGGHKKVPMAELKKMLACMGFENIKTLLNSGNVVFETQKTDERELVKKISVELEKTFGFKIQTMVRSMEKIQQLIELDPFKEIQIDKDARLYATFLPEKIKSSLSLPYISSEKGFRILEKTDREVFSVLNLNELGSVAAMAIIEKEYGKDVTTRNWNTVKKIVKK